MARIVTSAFVLQYPDQTKKPFAVGEIVDGADAEHWLVKAKSDEVEQSAPADEAKEVTKPAKKKAEKVAEPTEDQAPADEAKEQ